MVMRVVWFVLYFCIPQMSSAIFSFFIEETRPIFILVIGKAYKRCFVRTWVSMELLRELNRFKRDFNF